MEKVRWKDSLENMTLDDGAGHAVLAHAKCMGSFGRMKDF